MGNAPRWYKIAIVLFLLINPIIFYVDPFLGWLLVVEFIFTLAMALKCYPLQPGGLLAIEAVLIGMTSANQIKHELVANIEVLLLLVFMVAGIYFMKQLLLYVFTKMLVRIHSKTLLSLAFCLVSAFLSAFLDALTVIAVVISVATGFYAIYHKVASRDESGNLHHDDEEIDELSCQHLNEFRAFLRSLMMHAAIGTALGASAPWSANPRTSSSVNRRGWHFGEFAIRMAPVTIPVFICGLLTCILVEKFRWFGYGARLPEPVRHIMESYERDEDAQRTPQDKAKLIVQALIATWLITGLALHLAAVGLIGLTVIVLATAFTGVTEEHALGKAFQEALPFTALLTVFFSVVAVIIDQQLFKPVIQWVLAAKPEDQLALFYLANGLLSMVSDNVFVGTVYINEVKTALINSAISREHFDLLAVAINTGTNLPSVATPMARPHSCSCSPRPSLPCCASLYGRMVWMALPYTLVLGLVGFFSVELLLGPATEWFYQAGWLLDHGALPLPTPSTH